MHGTLQLQGENVTQHKHLRTYTTLQQQSTLPRTGSALCYQSPFSGMSNSIVTQRSLWVSFSVSEHCKSISTTYILQLLIMGGLQCQFICLYPTRLHSKPNQLQRIPSRHLRRRPLGLRRKRRRFHRRLRCNATPTLQAPPQPRRRDHTAQHPRSQLRATTVEIEGQIRRRRMGHARWLASVNLSARKINGLEQ